MVASMESFIISCNSGLSMVTTSRNGEEKRIIMKPVSWWVQLLYTQIRWKWSYKFQTSWTCLCIYKREIYLLRFRLLNLEVEDDFELTMASHMYNSETNMTATVQYDVVFEYYPIIMLNRPAWPIRFGLTK